MWVSANTVATSFRGSLTKPRDITAAFHCALHGGCARSRQNRNRQARLMSGMGSRGKDSPDRFDVIVVGGGVMGSWAAARAAARGASVALLDQFDPGHEHGSSHGDGRIYRFAYQEDLYVDMMAESLTFWEELERFEGKQLHAETGGLSINWDSARGSSDDTLGPLEALYKRRGLTHEVLTAAAVSERFPQFSLPQGMEALYQPQMGVLFATKCVQATWRYAGSLGALLRPGTRVESLSKDGNGAVVTTESGEDLRARRLVLAPGAWLSGLTERLLKLRIPTQVSAETVSYFAPRADSSLDFSYKSMPVMISYMNSGLGAYGYYGLPSIEIPGVKVSAHFCGPIVDPCRRPASAGGFGVGSAEEASAAARIAEVVASNKRIVAAQWPGLEHEPFLSQNCLYTCTADHDYIVGPAPGFPQVILAGGGSGHAFKMGPAIGELCASLALRSNVPQPRLEQFAVERLLGSGSAGQGTRKAARK